MATKVQTPISFEPDEIARLRELSKAGGAPVAEIVRRAVRAYLDRTEKFTASLAAAEALEPGFLTALSPAEIIAAARATGLR